MAHRVDARGLSCPQPVVLTKKALAELQAGQLEVVVDNPAARDNVLRFARSAGCQVELSTAGDDYLIRITKKQV
ncbi:MAG: hypothetical protein PWP12_376 [Bacillota bacterium]|jgi:TusA-related sulfurtransferase|nr:hypothetical protein [Bacillota bacterium]MDK2882071.1 hypothetical protein [Bacillota bacterium]MDK2960192.1 hypothetical protein [Bacillota bacterium]